LSPSADPAAPGREAEEAVGFGAEPDWLTERRRKGASLARELALPTQKQKGWEFTDLTGLELDAYAPATARVEGLVDGGDSADGPPVVMPLRDAAERLGDVVSERFGSLVAPDDPFVARNEAAWETGVLVYVPRGQRLSEPVRLSVAQEESGTALNWRTLIVLEEGAEAEVWERYESPDDVEGLFNGVVELVVGEGANLRYVCEQELSERSWIFATQRAELARDASLEWISLGFGSARGKVRMETRLAGRGSSAKVTGAYAGGGTQHLDFDTTQEHVGEHTTSDLAFRGVLGEKATAVWRGMIKVDPGAQQTDAFQESRNLLLSREAHADAIPGLEIEADDVRCTHAAAVAQVDPDQLYYLRSHGLAEEQAKRLVIEGFLAELVERMPAGETREALGATLERRLAELLAVPAGASP
jgi:Fe-S cluster assembly protein SufD